MSFPKIELDMGLIIPSMTIEEMALTHPNAYVAIADNLIQFSKLPVLYNQFEMFYVKYQYTVWSSLDARIAGKLPLTGGTGSFMISQANLIQNVYSMIYGHLKQLFPEGVDHFN
jgi:hypothetical protein